MSKDSPNNFTCFIISPIGNKLGDGEQQKKYQQFRDVFDYLVMPALRLAGFNEDNIIRSDQESGVGRISKSIMAHLKQDDLCIADLTGLNPNVMYEYGVRVGIGKPVIPIASAETKLPFDVHDMRTILYNIDTTRGLMEAQKLLENTVRAGVIEGFSPKSGAGSFTELSERLQRIERSLAELTAGSATVASPSLDGNATKVIRELGSVTSAFNFALKNRDVALGEELLPRLKAELEKDRYIDLVVSQLASLGSRKAGTELKENWEYITQNLSLQQQFEEIGCYISYCNRTDLEIQEFDFISSELEKLENRVKNCDIQEPEKEELLSSVYNQANRFYYGAYNTANKNSNNKSSKGIEHKSWLITAIDYLEKAIELKPNEASYYYNLAICYRENKQLEDAVTAIDKCIELGTNDVDHLRLAYEIYIDSGNGDKAKSIKETLAKISPYAAAML